MEGAVSAGDILLHNIVAVAAQRGNEDGRPDDAGDFPYGF
jgi:hypothetical protein